MADTRTLYTPMPIDWDLDTCQEGLRQVIWGTGIGIHKDQAHVFDLVTEEAKAEGMRVVKLTIEFVEH